MGDDLEQSSGGLRRLFGSKGARKAQPEPNAPLKAKPAAPAVVPGDQAQLTIDLQAIEANWLALNAMTEAQTGAVVKANAYGLGLERVAPVLANAGAWRFFVANVTEGQRLRKILGPDYDILVFAGHMQKSGPAIMQANLIPMLNSLDQITRHFELCPDQPYGIQLDTGMNRLGLEIYEWEAVRDIVLERDPFLIISHLACSDVPEHPMNAYQLEQFRSATRDVDVPLSLSATGGIFLGDDYHFDLTRPGIGLYGGLPFVDALPVVKLDLPVVQVREVAEGEFVGYGNSWRAERPTTLATVSAGYADGIHRSLSNGATLWHGSTPCPLVGRVSMDLITVDISGLTEVPNALSLIGKMQDIDTLATAAGTIGYEVLTSLGSRYHRTYATA